MLRTSLFVALALCIGGSWAAAQDAGLPAPPKPPKSKAKQAEAEKGNNAEKPNNAVPADPAPDPGAEQRGDVALPRPRRVRIDVPFFHMDLDLGGHDLGGRSLGGRFAPRAAVPDRATPADAAPKGNAAPTPRAEEIPAPAGAAGKSEAAPQAGQDWRYRWHDGRWWYWMPSERWVYWDGGRWNEAAQPARRVGALRNFRGLEGLNLQDLMQSDEIRIGQPRRGNIGLEFEGLPPVNFGF